MIIQAYSEHQITGPSLGLDYHSGYGVPLLATNRVTSEDYMFKPSLEPMSALHPVLVVLVTAAVLGWPALLLNHAPLIFSDTLDYFKMGFGSERHIRPRGYAWFAAPPAWVTGSLWPVVMMQSVITAALVHAALHVTLPNLGVGSHLCAGFGLAAVTSAPWAASYIMPDALTAPALLGLFLVLTLPSASRCGIALAAGVVALAAACHITHLATVVVIVAAFGLCRFGFGTAAAIKASRLVLAIAAAAFGSAAVVGVNFAVTGHAEYARGGGVFLAARLTGDGVLQHYLVEACPDSRLPILCTVRNRLPHDADGFLWRPESPLREGGELFNWNWDWEAELAAANSAALRVYWPTWVYASLGRTLRQLVTLNAGDGLDSGLALAEAERLTRLVSQGAAAAMLGSRQAREELSEHPMATLPGPLALACATACIVVAVGPARRLTKTHPAVVLFIAVVLLGAAANAGAVGFGGAVHARYQSRVAWLFPLALGIFLAALWRQRQEQKAHR